MFPYKDRTLIKRELADLAQAGLPELAFGYGQKAKDRLTAEEFKALAFGHTLRGRDVRSGEAFTYIVAADGSLSGSGDWGTGKATLSYLGNSSACYSWQDWGTDCGAVFRNPEGAPERQDEFIWVTACCEYRFSVDK